MKKTFTKFLAALMLLAIFTPSMIAVGQTKAEGDTHEFSQTLQQLLNNSATISSINIPAQSYSVKKVTISYRYNKTITNAVTMEVEVDGTSWGTEYSTGTENNYTTVDFEGTPATGAIVISFTNNTGSGTGHGTFYVDKIILTEGPGGSTPTTYTVTYDCNGGESGCPSNVTGITAGTSITLAAAPTKTDYTFNGWSDGTDTYDAGDSYTVNSDVTMTAQWLSNVSYLFYESFDDCNGTGGNDNQWSGSIASSTLTADNTGWTFVKGSGANKCAKFGTGSALGSAQTPAISHTGNATLTFKAAAWSGNSESTTLKLSATSGTLSASTVTLVKGAWTDYTINITGITTSTQIQFEGNAATNSRFFLDEVMVVEAAPSTDPTIVASDMDINYNTISGSIAYTIDNEPTPAGTLTASTTASWLTFGTVTSSAVPFTCTTNDNVVSRSATVTLTYAYGSNESTTKDITVTQGVDETLGTADNPYTVAQARTFIDGLGGSTSTEKYVSGIVSQVDSYNSQYSSITYWISDDGTTTNQLQVYSGKGIDGADFSSVNDVEVTAEVVVKGNLKKHNSTYEFDYNNELVVYNGPQHNVEAPTFSPVAGTYTTSQTVSITTSTSSATIYYTLDGTEPTNASTQYTTALTVSTATTIKAVAYDGTNYSNVTTAIYHINSQANPYTVAQVKDMPAYQLPANGVYVSGIVSQDGTSLSSGALNYYISADGTTGNELYVFKGKNLNNNDFSATTDIQAGDIVTIYGNIIDYVSGGTTTREFTSGNHLVAYERPVVQYDLTVSALSSNVNGIYVFDANDQSNPLIANGAAGTVQVTPGTSILVSPDIALNYGLASLTVGSNDVTSQVTGGEYTFTMPAHDVTISATAALSDDYELFSGALVEGDYLIVYDNKAMNNTVTSNRLQYAEAIPDNGIITTAYAAIIWHIAPSETDGYWTIYSADAQTYAASTGTKNQATTITDGTDDKALWSVTVAESKDNTYEFVNKNNYDNNVNHLLRNNETYGFACYAAATGGALSLYKKVEPTPTTATYYYSVNGTLGEAQTCAVGSTKTLETGTDLYINFNFAGWTTDANDVSSPISSYTFQDANPVTFYAVYAHNSNYYTRVLNETATADIDLIGPSIIPSFGLLDMATYEIDREGSSFNVPYLLIEEGGQFIYRGDDIKCEIQKTIVKPSETWGEEDNTGWYAISSPVGRVSKYSEVDNFQYIVNGVRMFDYFTYGEHCGWYNKINGEYISREIKAGVGYLYARAESAMIAFRDYSNRDDVELTNLSYTSSRGNLAGLHCIGNPYAHNIYKGVGITGDMAANYYALNEATGAWISTTDATPIVPMQAIMVFVNKTDGTAAINMTSNNSAPSSKANNDYIQFTVANGQYEDVAYAWFDNIEGLNKINHRNSEVQMVYIPQGDINYSIAPMADNTQAFNLNFKAMTTGKYTLSYKTQGEFNYMHIYDRLTGEDVDMLLEGEYSFISSPNDNDARFIVRLGYTPNYDSEDSFVYQNGNDIIVNGNGELQVFDVTGRKVMNTMINGIQTVNMPSGVYVFRMIGETVKTQKIIVR